MDQAQEDHHYVSDRKRNLPLGPDAPHYPNKKEGNLLRRLMSETGQTEEEVRSHKKYRRLLAQARLSSGNKRRREHLNLKRLARQVAKEKNLLPTHPEVQAAVKELIDQLPWHKRPDFLKANHGWHRPEIRFDCRSYRLCYRQQINADDD